MLSLMLLSPLIISHCTAVHADVICACVSARAEVNPLSLLGFVASLLALLGLLVTYWLQLTMFAVLLYLIPPAIAAFFFGHSVLHALHTASVAATAAANKPKKD